MERDVVTAQVWRDWGSGTLLTSRHGEMRMLGQLAQQQLRS